jgi:hypothetical protein
MHWSTLLAASNTVCTSWLLYHDIAVQYHTRGSVLAQMLFELYGDIKNVPNELLSYAGGSIATGRTTHAGQFSREVPD